MKTVKWMRVTPEMAERWLDRMIEEKSNPRRFRQHIADRYAREMAAGSWETNGESIIFDDLERLIDGQHRMAAIVKSGKAQEMVVVTGIRSALNVDAGFARRDADYVALHLGIQNGQLVTTVARRLAYCGLVSTGVDKSRALTRSEICAMLTQYPQIHSAANECHQYRRDGVITSADAATLLARVVIDGGDAIKAHDFLGGVATGANLSENDPRLACRNRLAVVKFTGREAMNERMWVLFRAHLAFAKGERIKQLRYSAEFSMPPTR